MSGFKVYLNQNDLKQIAHIENYMFNNLAPSGEKGERLVKLFDKLLDRQDQSESHLKSGAKQIQKRP